MFQSRRLFSRIAKSERNCEFLYLWCWVAKYLGSFPKDIVKLIGKYCIVRNRRSEIFLENRSQFLQTITFYPTHDQMGDMISVICDPIYVTQISAPALFGSSKIQVASSEWIKLGMHLVMQGLSFHPRVIDKTYNTLTIDRPLSITIDSGYPVMVSLHIVENLVFSNELPYEIHVEKKLPSNLTLFYTNNTEKWKKIEYNMETIYDY